MDILEKNKQVVIRFNKEVLETFNEASFKELMHPDFVNRTPAPNMSPTAEGVAQNLKQVLQPAFPDLKVEIYEQIAEGDKVTTRKAIVGTHLGSLMGIAPTGKNIRIDVIDIVHIKDGQYYEHWGINNLASVVASLREL